MQFVLDEIICADSWPVEFDRPLDDENVFDLQSSPNAETLLLCSVHNDSSSGILVLRKYEPWVRVVANSKEDLLRRIPDALKSCITRIEVEQKFFFYGFYANDAQESKRHRVCKVYVKRFADVEKLHRLKLTFCDKKTSSSTKAFLDLNVAPSSWILVEKYRTMETRISSGTVDFVTSVAHVKPVENDSIPSYCIASIDCEMYSPDNQFPNALKNCPIVTICVSILTFGTEGLDRHAFVLWDSSKHGSLAVPGFSSIHECPTEHSLLESFSDFLRQKNPDLITGWNIYGFDLPYMWTRYNAMYLKPLERGTEGFKAALYKLLGVPFTTCQDMLKSMPASHPALAKLTMNEKLNVSKPYKFPESTAKRLRKELSGQQERELTREEFYKLRSELPEDMREDFAVLDAPRLEGPRRGLYLSKILGEKSTLIEKRMTSGAKGDNTYYFFSGRTYVDMMHIIKDDKKLDENSLKFAAQTFLDAEYGKIDLSPQEIFAAYRTKDKDRMQTMIAYCGRDADIPLRLMVKLGYFTQWIEMSRVTFTPLHAVLNGGQQRKVYNLIARFVGNDYVLNDPPYSDEHMWPTEDNEYQGATVIEPITGFYQTSVSTLDFESLYPSIMIHYNLCPSTFDIFKEFRDATKKDIHTLQHASMTRDYHFVKHVEGVVPRLLKHLLKQRKLAKSCMAKAKTDIEKQIQNGRQLALKVSCNSVYGFFGANASTGILSCKSIAAITTQNGRKFIDAAKSYVEQAYPGSKVLYGDTDSIMIRWSSDDVSVARAYVLAEEASAKITALLRSGEIEGVPKPLIENALQSITLANEKVYRPFLLLQKKTYAGLKFTLKAQREPQSLEDFDSGIDMKGIDAVRRDRSKLVRKMSEEVLDCLLVQNSLTLAFEKLKASVDSVLNQTAPLDLFVLSKSLKTTYASDAQPHVKAWKKMKDRGDSDIPEIGSRMPFIIVENTKAKLISDKTEHPAFVAQKKLAYDAVYYLENAKEVILRLLQSTSMSAQFEKVFHDAIEQAENKQNKQTSLFQYFKKTKLQ